ncbi:MAG: hypothetical protein WDA65_01560 [Christensenellales bacterium]
MRKLFLLTRMQIQAYTRRRVWIILLSFGFLFTLVCYYFVYPKEPYLAINQTAYGQAVLTLIFMMIGIEMQREQRREHMDDIFASYSKNTNIVPWSQVLAIGFLSLALTLLILTGCFIRMHMDAASSLWIAQSLKYIVLLFLLPCLIMGVWGLLISHWNKGKSVYLPAVLMWLLTSSLCIYFVSYLPIIWSSDGRFLYNAFNMGINNFHMFENLSTGAAIEVPRWIVRIGILIILTALFLCANNKSHASTRAQKRKGWIKLSLAIAFGLAITVFFYARYNVFFTRFAEPNDVMSYVSSKNSMYMSGEPVSLTDFPTEKNVTINKTDINLTCTTQGINAEVVMQTTQNKKANGQSFVLYSDLIVDEVRIDGEAAAFERSHDGLMVYYPKSIKSGDIVTFKFIYHGYSLPNFPANETTVQLNRSFPWIPWPGIKSTNSYGNNWYDETEMFFIEDWQREDEVEYTLKYKGPGNLYTNLDTQSKNLYTGVSGDGVSIYSGMSHKNHRGVDVYVPASRYQYAALPADAVLDAYDKLLDLCERMGTIKKPQKPKSVIVMYMRCPIIGMLHYAPQELYSREGEWEIRIQSESSSVVSSRKWYADSVEDYKSSTDVNVQMAIPYIISPCTGYPTDVPQISTNNFAAWLSAYILVKDCDDEDMEYYAEVLREGFLLYDYEFVNGELVSKTPLTEQEEIRIDRVLERMRNGENFDEPFRSLYQRLLQAESITLSDIVSLLYYHRGE